MRVRWTFEMLWEGGDLVSTTDTAYIAEVVEKDWWITVKGWGQDVYIDKKWKGRDKYYLHAYIKC